MEIREAILKAADHIEANPGEFDFNSIEIPGGGGCGTPGCALGWIGHFMGLRGYFNEPSELLGLQPEALCGDTLETYTNREFQFYNRMKELFGGYEWKHNATNCAIALRKYADKYHPAATPARVSDDSIPESVRRIFAPAPNQQEKAA